VLFEYKAPGANWTVLEGSTIHEDAEGEYHAIVTVPLDGAGVWTYQSWRSSPRSSGTTSPQDHNPPPPSGLRKSRRSLSTSSLWHVHRELDDLESEDLLEAAVSGRESESVLFAQSRDPDVVLLYRNAGLPE
jgi:hypothetical protein